MNDLISVIIPAYNAEKYLDDCLKSITSQTYKNLEILVVNDGSQDATGEIAENWSRKDKRVIVIHQCNNGVSSARNAGLDNAKGRYIGFVDADDEVESDMFEFLLKNLVRYNVDISHCGFQLAKSDDTIYFHNSGILLVQSRIEALKELLKGRRVEPSICNKLYKRDIIGMIRFDISVRINEDLLFNVEVFNKTDKSVFEDIVKYKYKYNLHSASRSSDVLFIEEDVFKVAKNIRKILEKSEMENSVEIFYLSKLLRCLKILWENDLYRSDLSNRIRNEVDNSKISNVGVRLYVLKLLLIKVPFLYKLSLFTYELFFAKNQKWKV